MKKVCSLLGINGIRQEFKREFKNSVLKLSDKKNVKGT